MRTGEIPKRETRQGGIMDARQDVSWHWTGGVHDRRGIKEYFCIIYQFDHIVFNVLKLSFHKRNVV